MQVSSMSGSETGYIGGFPDKYPIYISIELDSHEGKEPIHLPVSQYMPVSVLKSFICNKLGLFSRNFEFFSKKSTDEPFQNSKTLLDENVKNGDAIRLARNSGSAGLSGQDGLKGVSFAENEVGDII
jgi:hypothetical protein